MLIINLGLTNSYKPLGLFLIHSYFQYIEWLMSQFAKDCANLYCLLFLSISPVSIPSDSKLYQFGWWYDNTFIIIAPSPLICVYIHTNSKSLRSKWPFPNFNRCCFLPTFAHPTYFHLDQWGEADRYQILFYSSLIT